MSTPPTSSSDHIFKVVVSGPYAAGKTTFIASVSGMSLVTTERTVSTEQELDRKAATTVGMDFGVLVVPDEEGDIELRLHGTPGQERFRFMWEILAEGADAFVILLDGRNPGGWDEARMHISTLTGVTQAPGVIAVNWYHDPATLQRANEHFADTGFGVVGCDARDAEQVLNALVVVLMTALDRLEQHDEHVPMAGAAEWH